MIEIAISILLIIGGILSFLGSFGLFRFPDVYIRLHGAAKNSTLGVISVMIAVFLFFLFIEEIFLGKVLLTILFVFLTAPLAGLLISRSAYRSGVKLWDKSIRDDLGRDIKEHKKQASSK